MATVTISNWSCNGCTFGGSVEYSATREGTSSSAVITFKPTMRLVAGSESPTTWAFWYQIGSDEWVRTQIKPSSSSAQSVTTTVTATKAVGNTAGSLSVKVCLEDEYTSGTAGESSQKTVSISYGAKTQYNITYNSNNGKSQTKTEKKWHGETYYIANNPSWTKADAKASTFTITFNGNGGTPASASASGAKWNEYSFSKWNKNASGTSTVYNVGASYTANSALTLYAVWAVSDNYYSAVTLPNASRSNQTFTCTFNANGGSVSTTSKTCTKSFTHSGWNTNSSGTGTSYTKNATIYPQSATTLYATWTSSTTTLGTLPTPTRSGYTFTKWNTKADGTGTNITSSTQLTGNVTAYAIWSQNSYTVTFKTNHDTSTTFTTQTKLGGVTLKLTTSKPTRTGYSFTTWNTKADGTGTSYASGGNYTANSAVTLYAQWTPVASTLSVANTAIGSAPKCTWTAYEANRKFKLTFSLGSWSYTTGYITAGTTGSYTYSGYTIPMDVCNQLPNAVSGSMTVTLTSYMSDNTKIGTSSKSMTATVPASVVPDFSYTLSDTGESTFSAYTIDSIVTASLTNIVGAYGSTPKKAEITVGGYSASVTPTDRATITTGKKMQSGVQKVDIKVTDSRSRVTTKTTNITVWEYFEPKVEMKLANNEGDITLTIKGDVAPVNNENEVLVWLTRTLQGAEEETLEEWESSTYTFTITYNDYLEGVDASYKVYLSDSNSTVTKSANTSVGSPITSFDSSKHYDGVELQENHNRIVYRGDMDCTIGANKFTLNASDVQLDSTGLVAFPIDLEELHTYQVSFDVNKLTDTVTKVAYVNSQGNVIEHDDILTGSKLEVPEGTASTVLLFGQIKRSDDYVRTFTGIKVEELFPTTVEEIPWFWETIDLGLDDANQKYISKIQLRVAFSGTASISIAYENGDFKQVWFKENEDMKSFTVPINVRRCDHFRLRMEGIGQVKLYSFGYSVQGGSQRDA